MKKFISMSLAFIFLALSTQSIMADINASDSKSSLTNPYREPDSTIWLGVWVDNLPSALGHHLSSVLKTEQGLIIKQIAADSPAEKAGLQAYDIIARFHGQDIYSQQQLTQLIQTTKSKAEVDISIVRQGKLLSKKVVLDVNPTQNKRAQKQMHPAHQMMPKSQQQFKNNPWQGLPAPFANDPFFNSNNFNNNFNNSFGHGFNQQFMDAFNRDSNQQMQQLRQKMMHLEQQMKQQGSNVQQGSWSQFQSIQVESMGNDKHRASVSYQDSNGDKKEFVFEGQLSDLRQQIMAQDDMDEDKKQSLLQALEMTPR